MKTLHKPSGAMNHFRQLFTLSMIILSGISSSRGRGNSYFQQEVNYSIEVELDDASHYLRGKESFLYKNNSQDTLNILYLHVWPNAYRDENTVLARIYENDADQRMSRALARGENGFIDSLEFTADGNRLSWQSLPDTPDVLKLLLISPLYPGASVEISTPLRIKIPSAGISRFGHDKQSYYITQWYPKPAVYDDGGWKYLPYVDKGEFYSEFGSFDVKITLPENYVVGATGELVDGEKETEWLNNKMLETMAIEEFRKEDLSYPPSSDKTKTLHFRQDRVHDFAWFADKRWHVLKSTMELPASRERVTIWAFFTNRQASWWLKAPEYMERTVYDYSRWLGDYPYKNVTAVEVGSAEGADMEYPMITAIGTASSQLALESVLAHEVGHNWFYGILGNDERRYPWLDEGMNSFFDKRYIFTNYAGDSTKMNEYFNRLGRWGKWTNNTREDTRIKQYWRYLADARLNIDQSLTLRSEQFTLRNYGDMVYGKTSLGFQYLLSYLGDSIFDAAMHDYFRQWKFKHPRPDDLRTSLEKSTGKDLGWLFEDWLGSTEKLNYAVIGLETGSDSFKVSLKNRGGISGPVAIGKTDASGKKENVWLDGFDKDTIVVIDGKPTSPHLLDEGRWMPERNRKDNSIRESGVFRKTEPLQFRLWTDMEDPERTQLYISPALGWNLYNSVMTGMVIHNIGFPQKNLEFALMPMYAWGTKDLAGGGFLNYKIMPVRGLFKEIRMQTGLQHYALQEDIYEKPGSDFSIQTQLYFTRWENQIVFSLRNNTPRNRVNQEIRLRQMTTWQGIPLSASPDYSPTTVKKDFYEVRFKRSNNHPWHYRNAELNILVNNETVRSTLRYKLKTPYSDPRKGLHWQLFAGYVSTSSKNTYPNDYDFQLSGRRGYDDFMFDHAFLGRDETSGILSKQFVSTDGGFATFAPTRFSESWMITAGLKADIPGKLPVQAFFNIGCFERADRLVTDAVMFPYEAGLQINVLKEALKIYIPVTFSKDIRASLDNAGLLNFGERIRFELDLRALNPLDRINR